MVAHLFKVEPLILSVTLCDNAIIRILSIRVSYGRKTAAIPNLYSYSLRIQLKTMTKYKTPEEMMKKVKRSPVSARVNESTLKILKDASKKNGLPLATLVENVLNDYAIWLLERKSK